MKRIENTKADEFEALWSVLIQREIEHDRLCEEWAAKVGRFKTSNERKGTALRVGKARVAVDRARVALVNWCRANGETPPACAHIPAA
jgi:hypothetical protein